MFRNKVSIIIIIIIIIIINMSLQHVLAFSFFKTLYMYADNDKIFTC